jgi:UDP-N-acetylglucosamine transferase subunit ALG13
MIFVTVGTFKGEELLKRVDEIAPLTDEDFLCQTGHSTYIPRTCPSFKFAPSLDKYYQEARVVICHGGLGSTFELLRLHKPMIGVNNTLIPDNHQQELLQKLAQDGYILWCKELKELQDYIILSRTYEFKKYNPPACSLSTAIVNFLKK